MKLLWSKAPTWDVQFVKFNYVPEWQSGVFKGGGGGGAQINWMLAMQMYVWLEGDNEHRDCRCRPRAINAHPDIPTDRAVALSLCMRHHAIG